MSDSSSEKSDAIKTPWHLWVIGIVGLLWNSMGAMDFVMTMTKNEAYMKDFTPEQLDFFYGFPTWLTVFWAIAVFGGVIGSLLMLFRSSFAVPVFGASLVSMVITTIRNFGFDKMLEIGGAAGGIFTAVIFVAAVLLFLYAMRMKKQGVLR